MWTATSSPSRTRPLSRGRSMLGRCRSRGRRFRCATDIATIVAEVPVLTASNTGVIAYRKRPGEAANRRLVWADRNGKESEPVGPPIRTSSIQLSPDGERVAYAEGTNGPEDVWVYRPGARCEDPSDHGSRGRSQSSVVRRRPASNVGQPSACRWPLDLRAGRRWVCR